VKVHLLTKYYTGKGPRGRTEDNIRMDLREIGLEVADWFDVAHDKKQWQDLMNTVMNLQVHNRLGISSQEFVTFT
jgi:hypothetical protein